MCSAWTSSSPSAVNTRRRAVGPLLDVRAERGPPQHRAHLLGHAGQPARSGPAATAGSRLTTSSDPRCRTSAPATPGSARQPSGTQIVQSGSAITAGPTTGRRSGRPAAGRRWRTGDGARGPTARTATTSTGVVRAARSRCGARARRWNASTAGDGELVALARRSGSRQRTSVTSPAPTGTRSVAARSSRRAGTGGRAMPSGRCVERRRGRAGPGHDSHQVDLPGRGQDARPPTARRPGPGRSPPACPARRPARRRAAARRRRRPPAPAPRVDAPLDRHRPQRLLHRRVHHRQHALGGRPRRRRGAARAASTSSTPEPRERGVGGDAPGHQVGVGHRRLGAAPAVAGRPGHGAGAAGPDDRARRRRRRGRSIRRRRRWCARRATAAAPGARRPSRSRGRRRAAPSSTRHTSVLVPPMSKVMASGKPLAAATAAAGPHARRPGPTAAAPTGRSAASATGTSPPAEVITSTSSASVGQPREVGAAHRAQVGVDHRGDRALVLAELGRHLVRARHVEAPAGQRRPPPPARGPGRGRRAAGTPPPPRTSVGDGRRRVGSSGSSSAPSAASRPGDLEPRRPRHQRRRAGRPTGRRATAGPGGRSR